MAILPSDSSAGTVGVEIVTVADNTGTDSAKAGLAELDAESKALTSSVAGATSGLTNFNNGLKNVGGQMTAVGGSLSKYITLPIVGIAAASVKMAMDFQQSMELLHTNAGVPQAAIASLSSQILDLAGVVGQDPNSLAQAFYHIATAGQGIYTTAQELDQLKIAAEGAAIGQANLDDTTYALTSTLAANVKGATNTSQAMGTLLGIVQAGDMHLSDLNDVISTGLMGTLSTFGVSLQSAGAALADFGDLGEKGAISGTRLRMMLALMASPSAAAAKILGDLGLTTGETATATGTMNQVFAETGLTTTKLADDLRQPNGIYVAITDLKTQLEKAGLSASQTDTVLAKAFGGGRTDAALLQLLDTTTRLDVKYQQIGQDSGNFAQNWEAQQQTMKQQWDKSWGAIQADLIRIGESIMPEVSHAMNDFASAVGSVTNWYNKLSPGQKQFVIDAAGVLAAMGPVLVIFGTLAKSLSSILTLTQTVGRFMSLALPGEVAAGATEMEGSMAGVAGAEGLGAVSAAGVALASVFNVVLVAAVEYWALNSLIHIKAVHDALGGLNSDLKQWSSDFNTNVVQPVTNFVNKIDGVKGTANNVTAPSSGSFGSQNFLNNIKSWFATGTNYAPGGWSVVGENGPEAMYVPQGSQIKTNTESGGLTGGGSSTTVSIGNVYIANPAAAQEFYRQLNQDTLNLGKGLTTNQGVTT